MALVRAIPLVNALASALSTTDVSTGYNFPPSTSTSLASPQLVYGALHISSGFGSTARVMSLAIQSASSSGFPAGVANRITFTLTTSEGAQWGAGVAVSTDQPWWRASWTMSTVASTGGTWKFLTHFAMRP